MHRLARTLTLTACAALLGIAATTADASLPVPPVEVGGVILDSDLDLGGYNDNLNTSQAEVDFLRLLNQERVDRGLGALKRDSALDGVARDWSGQMANEWRLYHRPDLVEQIEARVTVHWQRAGENVGYGYSIQSLHQAFMDSAGHYANIVGDYNRLGVGVVLRNDRIWVTFNFMKGPEISGATGLEQYPNANVWLVGTDGNVYNFGSLPNHGSMAGQPLARPIVGSTATPAGGGYWLVASDGGIFSFGDARFYGSTGAIRLNQPIVGMAATPTGNGYWLVASDGGIFSYGDARFHGSTGAIRLNQPIVGMAPTPSGNGYWLVARDGGIFSFGDAAFYGSTGAMQLNQPINGMGRTPDGRGYWLVARDGGVFTFGNATFYGSAAGKATDAPVMQIVPTTSGRGYRMVSASGRVFEFGDAGSASTSPIPTTAQLVSIAFP